jgi:LemA protein
MILWIILGVVALLVIMLIALYNSLVVLRNKVRNAWAQIDVQLKKRFDLIPNLMETVKGYAKHEKEVLTEITKARNMMAQAKDVKGKAQAEGQLSGALKTLFAVSENYPDLKANTNFLQMQEELSGMESKIAYARQFYNDMVERFNNKIMMFPNNVLAGMMNFKAEEFFKTSEKEKENVKVKF